MRSRIQFSVIDSHSAGAPARVVVGGMPPVKGESIAEIRTYLERERDDIRKLLMYEPRGHSEMCGSILLPPCNPEADLGIVFIETGGWMTMCGAGTIGAATVVVETGMVPVVEPVTTVVFDTPAGLVTAQVEVAGGVVQGVTIENVPSFLFAADVAVEVPGYGSVSVDIAYGGNFYAIVPAKEFGLAVVPEHSARLAEVGRLVRDAVNKTVTAVHPIDGPADHIPLIILSEETPQADGAFRNLVFFGESGVDRSPGGTGTSARMAQRYGKGQQKLGEKYVQESIIGSQFEGTLVRTEQLGDREAVVPTIRGRAFITAMSTFVLDPDDPFPEGFGVGYASDAKGAR
ncbi:proline racemase family protein [Rhodococcoides kyotonense]|uniref:Proline racemase/trans-L-3-hydroxyproline dehydratase n=1 Tax=Rhodococcoides kyotonense TaxID=398843 RepID=A0A239N732_9NOCA|nr:proline racemase family protein [Rhodococcus kyotonensis]SNT50705.1 proline racemase/trans-L-3-hydroxyproline dehydratase [Rhodococcus kyotonensis]